MKLKCSNCKLQCRIDPMGDVSERLLYSYCGFDDKKRRLYTVYCRACRHLSYYRQALLGSKKVKQAIDARAFYAHILDGRISRDEMETIGAHIQLAMVEDRVLPPRWELS